MCVRAAIFTSDEFASTKTYIGNLEVNLTQQGKKAEDCQTETPTTMNISSDMIVVRRTKKNIFLCLEHPQVITDHDLTQVNINFKEIFKSMNKNHAENNRESPSFSKFIETVEQQGVLQFQFIISLKLMSKKNYSQLEKGFQNHKFKLNKVITTNDMKETTLFRYGIKIKKIETPDSLFKKKHWIKSSLMKLSHIPINSIQIINLMLMLIAIIFTTLDHRKYKLFICFYILFVFLRIKTVNLNMKETLSLLEVFEIVSKPVLAMLLVTYVYKECDDGVIVKYLNKVFEIDD